MNGGRAARFLPAAAAALVAAICAGVASAAVAPTPAASSNWAGYVLSAPAADPAAQAAASQLEFTNVTGTWVEPKASCTRGSRGSAAFWVGLGGSSDASRGLEQIGTSIDCTATGRALHSAWYELLPAPAIPITMKVAAGDTITAAVLVRGATVTLQITNRTRNTRFTKTIAVAAADLTSAEWIAEAPSLCASNDRCRVVPLANFGTVRFTRAAATASAHSGVISDDTWTALPVQLQAASGTPFGGSAGAAALPSGVSADGRAFSVAWQPAA